MKIKDGLEEKYKKYLYKNIDSLFEKDGTPNSYVLAVLLVTELVGEELDEGKSPEEAEKAMHGYHISGFMAGAVAGTIVRYHPRGEEFKTWWNERFGVKDAEGTVNPALVTISRDITKGKKAD